MKKYRALQSVGQSMVELALLLPVMLLITFIALDLGRGIYYYSAVFNAAREGSRYGIIQPNDYTGIDNAARKLTVGLDQSQVCVDTYSLSNGQRIKVSVSYIFQLITPLGNLIHHTNAVSCCGQFLQSGQFCLNSISEMNVER